MADHNPFKWCHFQANMILLCVCWYLRSSLSYCDLEEMMLERGLQVQCVGKGDVRSQITLVAKFFGVVA